jgi:hypothetical protein
VRFSPSKWLLACGFAWVAFGTATPAAEPIAAEKFTQLHTLIKPVAAEEKWAQIPWLSSLWEARKRAAAEGKPILLWEMDGHPLGCT